MGMMPKIKTYLRILRLCLAHTHRLNLGDIVRHQGRRYILTQGVCQSRWNMAPVSGEGYLEHIDESLFKKERTLRNLWHDLTFAWNFYRGYWFDIWVREATVHDVETKK